MFDNWVILFSNNFFWKFYFTSLNSPQKNKIQFFDMKILNFWGDISTFSFKWIFITD